MKLVLVGECEPYHCNNHACIQSIIQANFSIERRCIVFLYKGIASGDSLSFFQPRVQGSRLHTRPKMKSVTQAERDAWSTELQLRDVPLVTKADVMRAYKTLALERHPDKGGSHAMMTSLSEARQLALRDLAASGGSVRPRRRVASGLEVAFAAIERHMEAARNKLFKDGFVPPSAAPRSSANNAAESAEAKFVEETYHFRLKAGPVKTVVLADSELSCGSDILGKIRKEVDENKKKKTLTHLYPAVAASVAKVLQRMFPPSDDVVDQKPVLVTQINEKAASIIYTGRWGGTARPMPFGGKVKTSAKKMRSFVVEVGPEIRCHVCEGAIVFQNVRRGAKRMARPEVSAQRSKKAKLAA